LTIFYYIWKIKDRFENKKVLELGCGYSGLASIIISKYFNSKVIVATDGNYKSIEHLNNIIFEDNKINMQEVDGNTGPRR
jgi:16S rRNA G1207 methylase RsmC